MKTVIGIDFGTSTTVIAKRTATSRYEPEIIEVEGQKCTDTVIRIDCNGNIIEAIGHTAWVEAEQFAQNTFFEFKTAVGCSMNYTLPSGMSLTADNLAIIFLERIRTAIENFYGGAELEERSTTTVVGYPPDWPDSQKQAVVQATIESGFPNVTGCDEPLAVLYFHHYKGDLDLNKPQHILVYDLGGGTTDTCLVQVSKEEQPKILSTGGENVGGSDFDETLAIYIEQQICDREGLTELAREDKISVRKAGRTIKEKLSDEVRYGHDCAKFTIPPLFTTGRSFKVELSCKQFENLCEDHITHLDVPIKEVLERAKKSTEDIDLLIIAGGMGRLYLIREQIKQRFPNLSDKEIITCTNPQEVISKGLVMYGVGSLLGHEHHPMADVSESSADVMQGKHYYPQEKGLDKNKAQSPKKQRLSKYWNKHGKVALLFLALLLGSLFYVLRPNVPSEDNFVEHTGDVVNQTLEMTDLPVVWQQYIVLAYSVIDDFGAQTSLGDEVESAADRDTDPRLIKLHKTDTEINKYIDTIEGFDSIPDISILRNEVISAAELLFDALNLGSDDDNYLDALELFEKQRSKASVVSADIVQELAPPQNDDDSAIEVSFHREWTFITHPKIAIKNNHFDTLNYITLSINVIGEMDGERHENKYLYFIHTLEPQERRYHALSDIDFTVDRIIASYWSPVESYEGIVYEYTNEIFYNDIAKYMRDFNVVWDYTPSTRRWLRRTQPRSITLFFEGVPYLQEPIVTVSFSAENGAKTQTQRLMPSRWEKGHPLVFETSTDGLQWAFEPEEVDIRVGFLGIPYTWSHTITKEQLFNK